jgi:hypothetical protein
MIEYCHADKEETVPETLTHRACLSSARALVVDSFPSAPTDAIFEQAQDHGNFGEH